MNFSNQKNWDQKNWDQTLVVNQCADIHFLHVWAEFFQWALVFIDVMQADYIKGFLGLG